jgi:zinc transport system ATP-binding protein
LPITIGDFFGLRGISLEEARRSLRDVGLGDDAFSERQLGVISSGQFQRVLIAWALAGDPDVLIFDEPSAGIDAQGEEEVQALLTRAQKQRSLTIILVTHDQSAIDRQATRVLRLDHPRVEIK